ASMMASGITDRRIAHPPKAQNAEITVALSPGACHTDSILASSAAGSAFGRIGKIILPSSVRGAHGVENLLVYIGDGPLARRGRKAGGACGLDPTRHPWSTGYRSRARRVPRRRAARGPRPCTRLR